jgi:hypothetical protein
MPRPHTRASPDLAQKALERVVIWHVYIDTIIRTLGCESGQPFGTRMRVSGVHATGRPFRTMSCELELLSGRPLDLPGCAASANP